MSDVALNIAIKATNQANAAFAQVVAAQNKIKLAADQAKVAYDSYVQVMAKAKSTQSQMQVAADQVAIALDKVKIAETGVATAAERARAAQEQATSAMQRETEAAHQEASAQQQTTEATHNSSFSFGEMVSQLSNVVMGIQSFIQMVSGAIQSLVGLASALISSNAAMEQATIAMQTLLPAGQQAKTMLTDLWNFAAKTPFQFPDVDQAAQKLIAFGISARDTIPDLTAIGDALSALGRTTPAALEGVVNIFGKIQTQGRMMTRDMMMFSDWGINAWKILGDKLHLTHLQLQTMITKGLLPAQTALKLIRAGMEDAFGGGMQKQALTFNGLMTTVKDNIQAALRNFTDPLFNAAKAALQQLGDLVASKQFQDFATTLGQAIAPAIRIIGQLIGGVINGIKQWMSHKSNVQAFANVVLSAANNFQSIVTYIQQVYAQLKPLNEQLGLMGTNMDNVRTQMNNATQAAKGMIGVLMVIGTVGEAIIKMQMFMWQLLASSIAGVIWALGKAYNAIAGALHLPTIDLSGIEGFMSSLWIAPPAPKGDETAVNKHPGKGSSPGTGPSGSGSTDTSGLGTGTGTGKGGKKAQLFTAADIADLVANARAMGLKFNKALFEQMSATQRIKYIDQLVGDSHKKLAELLKKTHKGLADYVLWYIENQKKGKGGLILDNGVSGSVVTNPVSASKYNASFIMINNVHIMTDAKSGHDLYEWLLKRLELDLRRSGQLASMASGGKAA